MWRYSCGRADINAGLGHGPALTLGLLVAMGVAVRTDLVTVDQETVVGTVGEETVAAAIRVHSVASPNYAFERAREA